ncbi:glycosyltransferase family 2 protein [Sphingomonas bacterium]|uniref:glycosyltransferase family 2 protein n=1 Tax=Sphingomonas bacterium TaxID=1895847 RepID=UPI0020C5DF7C|nr:glycosyltransferase family A protein [Sphingomonas bacterium]
MTGPSAPPRPTTPAVSVVMAAYNGAMFIEETLASLGAQTLTDWEAVIVDDRSTDDTLAVLRAWPDPRVRVIAAERNGGPVVARNIAFAAARGRYVAGLDHDDLCRPERFARQVAYLDRHPAVVLAGSAAAALCDGQVTSLPHPPVTTPALIEWLLRIENPLVWSSVMMRRDVARRLDPFTRPDLVCAEDFDFYHRLARFGRITRLDDELTVYRQHRGGMSKRLVDAMHASATRVLTGAYGPVLGEEAGAAAALVVRHVMAQAPVPDRATLGRLGAVLVALQEEFLASRDADGEDVRLIRWETARRWARIGRAALRTGGIDLVDAMAVRPDHVGLGYAGPEQLIWSRLVGRARGWLKRA